MKVNKTKNSLLLLLAAFIWGVAFVAQSEGGDAVGPLSFNSIRFVIGGFVLLPVIAIMNRGKDAKETKEAKKQERKALLTGGILCGLILFFASTSQQLGLYLGASAGKAGFLTACYIILVPILGLFLKKRCGWNIWLGVVITVFGLYLLCMMGSFTLEKCDLMVLLCALLFACHILVVDHFSPLVDGVKLSCIQFFTCGIVGVIVAFFVEMDHSLAGIAAWAPAFTTWRAWVTILYAGVLSSGVAYTLQIVGQKGMNPTVASLLMSLESVFSVLAGWVLLSQAMNGRELMGCVLIFVAVVLAQIPVGHRKS